MGNANDFIIENGVLMDYNGSDSCMVIPEGVTTIGFKLLEGKKHVTSVVIPASVTTIENLAFCGNWTWEDHPEYFTIHLTDLDAFCKIVPQGIVTFLPYLCKTRFTVNGKILEELNYPKGISGVSTLFKRCEDLKKVVIPEGVTEITAEAFAQCRNLSCVSLPGSLTSIGNGAFSGCPLTRLEIAEGASFKMGDIFGYTYPAGLAEYIDELSQYMDAGAVKNYIMPDRWKLLSQDSRARIYLTYQDAAMKKYYKKLLKPADFTPLSEAILRRLGAKLSKKECGILADFATGNVAYLSPEALKNIYEAVKAQKSGAEPRKILDANGAVKKKMAASASSAPKAARGNRSGNDTAFDNMGFDDNGVKIYDLGSKVTHAVIQPDFQVVIVDPKTGKTAKSVPKKGADPELYAAAVEDFKALAKGIKALYSTCRDALFALYLTGDKVTEETWKREWTGNPITRTLSSMVVWQQGDNCFVVEGNRTVAVDGAEYALTGGPVCLAHTAELPEENVTAWQRYFVSQSRKQPFLQIWEPVRKKDNIREDRYKGVTIRTGYLRNQRTLGVMASFYTDWDSDMTICALSLKDFDIEVIHSDSEPELEITKIVPLKWNRQSNAIISFLDRISIYGRLHRDDETIGEILDQFTLEQITDFLAMAVKHSLPKVTALLLEYKQRRFGDFDPMDDFVLEL